MSQVSNNAALQKAHHVPDQAILDSFSGYALIMGEGQQIVATNQRGDVLANALRSGGVKEVVAAVDQALKHMQLLTGAVAVKGDMGTVFLELTYLPYGEGAVLVLGKDVTMERNLRAVLAESRQRYKDLVEASSDFYWETDADGCFVFVSPKGGLGYSADDLTGKCGRLVLARPDDLDPTVCGGRDPFLCSEPIEEQELILRGADGEMVIMLTSSLPILAEPVALGAQPRVVGARGVCRDVTEERLREAALGSARRRENVLNTISTAMRDELEPTKMLQAAVGGVFLALEAEGARIYRLSGDGLLDSVVEAGAMPRPPREKMKLNELKPGINERRIEDFDIILSPTRNTRGVNGAVMIWRHADQTGWSRDLVELMPDVADQIGVAIEQVASLERIVKLSRTDPLTGLLNRRAFVEEELPRTLKRLARKAPDEARGALFYMDLDNFKAANDAHGHQHGDDVLVEIRELLMDHSRPGDLVARLGGDEFAMWLDGITIDTARSRAEALIRHGGERLSKFSASEHVRLSISIGIAMFNPDTNGDLPLLMAEADAAMYDVKNSGKSGFSLRTLDGKTAKTTSSRGQRGKAR